MEAMEGMKGSDSKGSDNDPSPTFRSIEKKRKSPDTEKTKSTSGRADKGHDNGDQIRPKQSKKVREDVQNLHAETQRLLRETPRTCFASEQAIRKPVTSLIEKIRQRKLLLSQSVRKTSTATLESALEVSNVDGSDFPEEGTVDDEIVFVSSKPPTRVVVKQEAGQPTKSCPPRDEPNGNSVPVDDKDEAGDTLRSQPSTPDIRLDWSYPNSACKSPPRSFLRAPLLESQDLYSDSQLSAFEDESPVLGDDEPAGSVVVPRLNLHLDSETQDDDRWLEEDDEKENKDPGVLSPLEHIPLISDVRHLMDDEAEDEDDDGDSLDDEGDESQETSKEEQDLLTQDAGEKPADIERRAELHSKWLEQQDLAMEDNILHRIESGWKNKGKKGMPTLLSDIQERASKGDGTASPFRGIDRLAKPESGDFVSPLEVLRKPAKDDVGLLGRATSSGSLGLDGGDPMNQDDYRESSDDEEAEENLRRQLFLQESEEKIEFLSVTDDESSREIFSLINKVNVATIKPRTATAHNEARSYATGHHQPPLLHHQSSFLLRKVTSTSVTTKQGSGNSRSYVFGRDDSNSREASRLDKKEQGGNATAGYELKINSTSQSTQKGASSASKGSLPKDVKPCGPSLFQVLKQQAAELASGKTPLGFGGCSSKGDNLSIFLAMKPSRHPRGSRRT